MASANRIEKTVAPQRVPTHAGMWIEVEEQLRRLDFDVVAVQHDRQSGSIHFQNPDELDRFVELTRDWLALLDGPDWELGPKYPDATVPREHLAALLQFLRSQ